MSRRSHLYFLSTFCTIHISAYTTNFLLASFSSDTVVGEEIASVYTPTQSIQLSMLDFYGIYQNPLNVSCHVVLVGSSKSESKPPWRSSW